MATVFIGDMGIGAELDEALEDVGIPSVGGKHEGGDAIAILRIAVEIQIGDEVLNDVPVAMEHGVMECSLPMVVDEMGVGAEFDEEAEHLDIAVFDGDHEWSATWPVGDIGIDLELCNQVLGGFVLTIFDGVVEGIRFVVVGQMRVGTELDEELDRGDVASFGGFDETKGQQVLTTVRSEVKLGEEFAGCFVVFIKYCKINRIFDAIPSGDDDERVRTVINKKLDDGGIAAC